MKRSNKGGRTAGSCQCRRHENRIFSAAPSPLGEQAEEKKGGNQEPADALGNENKSGVEEQQERQGSWEPPVPPLPAPPQLPQFLSLLEQLEQVWEAERQTHNKLEEALRRKEHVQQGWRGKQWAPTRSPPQPTRMLRRGSCQYGQHCHCGWHHHHWGHQRHRRHNLRGDRRHRSRCRCNRLPHH